MNGVHCQIRASSIDSSGKSCSHATWGGQSEPNSPQIHVSEPFSSP